MRRDDLVGYGLQLPWQLGIGKSREDYPLLDEWGNYKAVEVSPVKIADGVVQISAEVLSLFVKEDGSLWGMGSNYSATRYWQVQRRLSIR